MGLRPATTVIEIALAALAWLLRHPTTLTVLAIALVGLLYAAGAVGPMDWWGDGLEVRR